MSDRLLVDGYNVIHAWPDLRRLVGESLELARDALVARLAVLTQVAGTEVTVVFDAHRTRSRRETEEVRDGVRVVFTRGGHSADHAIERRAYAARELGETLVVATSDSFHRDMLRGMGAAVLDASQLLRQVEAAESELADRLRSLL